MKTSEATLFAEIEAFLAATKMAETTFGRLAVNDGKFVRRLREGGGVTLATAARIRDFIRQNSIQPLEPA